LKRRKQTARERKDLIHEKTQIIINYTLYFGNQQHHVTGGGKYDRRYQKIIILFHREK
jgi:hypothetical protein